MDNQVLQCIKERRSIRSFEPKPVEDEKLSAILEAGTYAASGMGMQSPIMVVVKDDETKEQLRKMNAAVMGNPDTDPFYGAPVIVIVLADKNRGTYVEDGSLVIGNLMLAAHSLGVGSCWIHRAKEEFESPEGKALLKKWGIAGDYAGVGHCILGYVKGDYPPAKPRKEKYIYTV